MKKGDAVYIVTAYRRGERENHSYVVGCFLQGKQAKECADSHTEYRGGKYACAVEMVKFGVFNNDDDSYSETIYKTKASMGNSL